MYVIEIRIAITAVDEQLVANLIANILKTLEGSVVFVEPNATLRPEEQKILAEAKT